LQDEFECGIVVNEDQCKSISSGQIGTGCFWSVSRNSFSGNPSDSFCFSRKERCSELSGFGKDVCEANGSSIEGACVYGDERCSVPLSEKSKLPLWLLILIFSLMIAFVLFLIVFVIVLILVKRRRKKKNEAFDDPKNVMVCLYACIFVF
jgi:hypothetical protein